MSEEHFWTVNGSTTFGIVPGELVGMAGSISICLQRGSPRWGAVHIEQKHGAWVAKHAQGPFAVPTILWRKCHQPGMLLLLPDDERKVAVSLRLHPNAALILKLREAGEHPPFFSVTTLYHRNQPIGGVEVGAVAGRPMSTKAPIFAIPDVVAPVIVVKRPRKLVTGGNGTGNI